MTILICCLSLNAHAQSEPQTEAADSLVYEEYVTALSRAFFENDAFERALTTYQKADTASMTDYDLLKYAMAAYFKHEYRQTLDIVSNRLESKPCDIGFVRLAFFCAVELELYDDAEQYADMIADMSPTDELYYYDYAYLIRHINAKPHPSPADQRRLILSYEQLITYYLTLNRSTSGRLQGKNGLPTAQKYAQKLLEIDPQNQKAHQALKQK